MARHIISLLILCLGLLASACSDQSSLGPDQNSLGPTAGKDEGPAFRATSSDTTVSGSGKKGGPGGSAGGFK
jgi:hypothetical protein